MLEQGLLNIARSHDVVETSRTPHGTMYVVVGPLVGPSGSTVRLRTVWIVDSGATRPRFVTAYPD